MVEKRVYFNKKVLKYADLYLKSYGILMVYGPPGAGKTYLGLFLAEKENYGIEILTGKESLRDEDMIGTFKVLEGNKVVWIDGPLTRAFRRASAGEKVVLLVDEITRIPTRYLNLFIEVINNYDPNYYRFYNHLTGEVLKAPRENLVFFVTANVNQVGTNEIPEALLDRFSAYLYVDYPSLEEEVMILKHYGISEKTAIVLGRFARMTRKMHAAGELEFPVSTRCLVTLAKAIKKAVKKSDPDEEITTGMELLKGQLPYITGSVRGNTNWEETAQLLLDLYLNVYREVHEELQDKKIQQKSVQTRESLSEKEKEDVKSGKAENKLSKKQVIRPAVF